MINNNSPGRRVYIFFIFGILLSAIVFTIDIFSERNLSKYLNDNFDILLPQPDIDGRVFSFSSLEVFKTKSNLINENIRLKNEVIELRKLQVENEKLRDQNYSYNAITKSIDTAFYNIIETSIIFKNPSEEYIISGGEDLNLKVKDLIIDENSFVVGVVSAVRKNQSIISSIQNPTFTIEGLDKYGNEYLITSDSENLIINSINVVAENTDIKYIYTDISYGHPGQFPIVDLSTTPVSFANDKISAQVPINFKVNYFSNIYLVKIK